MAETTLGAEPNVNSNTGTSGDTSGSGNTQTGGSAGSTSSQSSGGGTWRDSLPEEIRNDPSLTSFSDLNNFTKSYLHLKSTVGKKGVFVPGEKAPPEEWSNFYKEIGVPSADKYEVAPPKDYPIPDQMLSQYKEVAAKNGLLPKQASELLGWYSKLENDSVTQAEAESKRVSEEQMEGLKKEWGDAYDRELGGAQLAVKDVGGPDFVKYLNETGMGNDAQLIRFAAKVGKLLGEDKLRDAGVVSTGESPSDIETQIAEIYAGGSTNGYFDSNHPMHQVTVKKMESLFRRKTGGR